MRVLLLQEILPPYRLAFFQALSLSRDFELTIAYGQAFPGTALESLFNPPGVKTRRLRNRILVGPERVLYQHGWQSAVLSREVDVVIGGFNPRVLSTMFAFIASRLSGRRFIWWGHGISPSASDSGWNFKLRLRLARAADAVIFYAWPQANTFIAAGLPRDRVFVAQNAIDTASIMKLARVGGRAERNAVLYVGRLIPEKKVWLLLEAFALARPHLPPDSRLTIIGDGPERGRLEELSRHLGVAGNTDFVGAVYDESDLARWFNRAWVSVSAGYVGLSAVHSAAYGLPVLIADSEPHRPEKSALVAGENARFFRSDDPADLANCLTALAHDPGEWELMSQAARRQVHERFSVAGMVAAFEAAVQRATA